ncbi:MAG: HAD hydrolase family protein [Kofleriaceae bacterium]
MTRPLSDLRGPVRALFSDVDGTMTTGDRIEASTYEALERLGNAGIPVIMVTGRPAGFGHAFMKMTPYRRWSARTAASRSSEKVVECTSCMACRRRACRSGDGG